MFMHAEHGFGHKLSHVKFCCAEVRTRNLYPISVAVVSGCNVVDVGANDAPIEGVDAVALLHGGDPCIKIMVGCSVCRTEGLEWVLSHRVSFGGLWNDMGAAHCCKKVSVKFGALHKISYR